MRAKAIGLYVHIPFCVRKCNYCDFCSFPVSKFNHREKYIDTLCEEILSYKGRGVRLDTVFFGGGTPSLLSAIEMEKIFDAIRSAFDVTDDAEISMEVNPKTLTRENTERYLALGVNRFSIGMQSIHENELKMLGRIHSYPDFLESYQMLRECGANNINVDVMYGIPEQSVESFGETLHSVVSLSPEHISLYSLIFEEGTPFWECRDTLSVADEDTELSMYESAVSIFAKSGYSHYEISNYALNGMQCRHNLKYWRDQEYIGVGLAAHSYFEGRRFSNTHSQSEYLDNYKSFVNFEDLPDEEYEYVMLRLRLAEGIELSDYEDRFGKSFLVGREDIINSLVGVGLASLSDSRFSLTEKGFYVSNSIITELI